MPWRLNSAAKTISVSSVIAFMVSLRSRTDIALKRVMHSPPTMPPFGRQVLGADLNCSELAELISCTDGIGLPPRFLSRGAEKKDGAEDCELRHPRLEPPNECAARTPSAGQKRPRAKASPRENAPCRLL